MIERGYISSERIVENNVRKEVWDWPYL